MAFFAHRSYGELQRSAAPATGCCEPEGWEAWRCALAGTGCSSHNFAGEGRQKTICIHARDSQVALLGLEGFGQSLQ
ncbi:unnamed protein product [Ectocarpus sp. 13 AM-2016]